MSDILKIYKSIANMKVGSIKSRDIDKVKLAIRNSDLPMRMLLPSTAGDMGFIAMGNLQNMAWTIRDLCLFAPLTKGKGVEAYSKAMVEYLSLYMKEIKKNRNPTRLSNIVGVEGQMTPVQWADTKYWAIDIVLTVEEIL